MKTELWKLKEELIDAQLSAKCAYVVYRELCREAMALKRLIARTERQILVALAIVILLIVSAGCGMANGFGRDTENVGRWLREKTQPAVDSMELQQISSAIETQNRIMQRGMALQVTLQK